MILEVILEIVKRKESRPVIVGLCGPQGCGKSTLCKLACDRLRNNGWRVDCISLDDYYLSYESLLALRTRLKSPLYEFRGNPGTHDVALLYEHLTIVKHGSQSITIPTYDKQARGGLGDRIASRVIAPPLDILLVEGWMVGFQPCESPKTESAILLNESLRPYQKVWDLIDEYIFFKVRDLSIIYRWRWEQEVSACQLTNTHCRPKEEIDRFVDQFMPAYKLFYPFPPSNSIVLELDSTRGLARLG
jgi:D-glycerate 3-kinase